MQILQESALSQSGKCDAPYGYESMHTSPGSGAATIPFQIRLFLLFSRHLKRREDQ